MFLIRRRSHAPLSQAFRGPRRKYFRWGKAMRPRKPDETLSRHGLGARRVALLAPRGVLSKYRYPLSYVGANTKNFGKVQKPVPHFGRWQAYSEWGRSPGIRGPRKVPQRSEDTLWGFSEEGVSYSHVRGRHIIYFSEHAASFERAPPARRIACGTARTDARKKKTPPKRAAFA